MAMSSNEMLSEYAVYKLRWMLLENKERDSIDDIHFARYVTGGWIAKTSKEATMLTRNVLLENQFGGIIYQENQIGSREPFIYDAAYSGTVYVENTKRRAPLYSYEGGSEMYKQALAKPKTKSAPLTANQMWNGCKNRRPWNFITFKTLYEEWKIKQLGTIENYYDWDKEGRINTFDLYLKQLKPG
jgi:hypothetical protein